MLDVICIGSPSLIQVTLGVGCPLGGEQRSSTSSPGVASASFGQERKSSFKSEERKNKVSNLCALFVIQKRVFTSPSAPLPNWGKEGVAWFWGKIFVPHCHPGATKKNLWEEMKGSWRSWYIDSTKNIAKNIFPLRINSQANATNPIKKYMLQNVFSFKKPAIVLHEIDVKTFEQIGEWAEYSCLCLLLSTPSPSTWR